MTEFENWRKEKDGRKTQIKRERKKEIKKERKKEKKKEGNGGLKESDANQEAF